VCVISALEFLNFLSYFLSWKFRMSNKMREGDRGKRRILAVEKNKREDSRRHKKSLNIVRAWNGVKLTYKHQLWGDKFPSLKYGESQPHSWIRY